MKGVILAGGLGTRLAPSTKVTNKHLLPVYNKPMIYYPLDTLLQAGIEEILIISGPEFAGHFLRLLGSGKEFGCRFSYEIQDEPGGIAEALGLAESFVDDDNVTAILGDNWFLDDLSEPIKNFTKGAHVFLKEVPDAERFGVAELKNMQVLSIEEKPAKPKSPYAVTGCYIYDNRVFDIIRSLKLSARGQLEITDVGNAYIERRELRATLLEGFWSDMGTFESLHRASEKARQTLLAT